MIRLTQSLLFSLLMVWTLSPANLLAQDKEAIQKELKTFLESFAKDYENIPQSKNTQSLLKYFDEGAKSNLFIFGISGQSRVSNSDYKGFEAYLNSLVRATSLKMTYSVQDVYYTYTSAQLATLTYSVNYENKEEDGIWVKGVETVMMALEKRGDKWKIVHYAILQIEDEKLKGTCLCEIFLEEGDGDGEVVTKTTIPAGRSYSKKFNNFEFRTTEAEWIIREGENSFKRRRNGELVQLKGAEEIKLGIASSKKEAVLIILQKQLYPESCARLKTK